MNAFPLRCSATGHEAPPAPILEQRRELKRRCAHDHKTGGWGQMHMGRPVTIVEPGKSMPEQKPGKSAQDYATPRELVRAAERFLGINMFSWDLAAHAKNAVVFNYFSKAQNSLIQPWHKIAGWSWLNCPWGQVTPWAKKCAEEAALGAKIAFNVPSSTSTNWFRENVHKRAAVRFLNPKPSYDGVNQFPKDVMIAFFGLEPGYDIFRWKT